MGRPRSDKPDRVYMHVSKRFRKACKMRKALTGEDMTKYTDQLADKVQEDVKKMFKDEQSKYDEKYRKKKGRRPRFL